MQSAVAETLAALELGDDDAAARKLALAYAQTIDLSDGHCRGCDDDDCRRGETSGWAMRWIGPLLLDCLESLGATPLGRSKLKTKGAPGDGRPNQLAQLRAARRK